MRWSLKRSYFSCRHFAISIGYQLSFDAWGIILCLGERHRLRPNDYRYRFVMQVGWLLPRILWADEAWALNEPGYVQGLPVARAGIASSAWTGRTQWVRGVNWWRYFSVQRFEDEY